MNLFYRRMQSDWASWLAVAFIALLPFGRWSELPLSIFALSLAWLARTPENRALIRQSARFLLPLFLCFWIPMMVSWIDSYDPAKSGVQSLAALRFLAAALAMSLWLQPPSARERVLRWTAYLLLFWAVDGFIQLLFGSFSVSHSSWRCQSHLFAGFFGTQTSRSAASTSRNPAKSSCFSNFQSLLAAPP